MIVINGPTGVGKTTVGKRIADRVTGTAFIDGDWCPDLKSVTLLCDEEELTARTPPV